METSTTSRPDEGQSEQEYVQGPDGNFQLVDVAPDAKATPSGLRRSNFAGETGEGVYNFVVTLDGKRIFARELGEEALETYLDAQKSVDERNRALRANPTAPDAEALARTLISEQRSLAKGVLEQTLVAWELEVPFSSDAIKQLSVTARANIASKVVRASSLGGSENAPLSDGS